MSSYLSIDTPLLVTIQPSGFAVTESARFKVCLRQRGGFLDAPIHWLLTAQLPAELLTLLAIGTPPFSVDNPLPVFYYISIAIIWHPYKKATAAPHLHQAVRTVDLGGTYEKIIFEITISKRNYTPFKGKIQPTLYPPYLNIPCCLSSLPRSPFFHI